MAALAQKYGCLESQRGETYTFHEDGDPGVTWEYTFNPPHRRVMRATDAEWSDRTDFFEPALLGTLWTIIWEPKSHGSRGITQWLAFKLTHRHDARRRIILPVLEHFQRLARGR